MKKYFSVIAPVLAFLIGISLISGCTLSRMREQTDKNESTRLSGTKKGTESSKAERKSESINNEQQAGAANTEQWVAPANTEQWYEENSDNEKSAEGSSEDADEKAVKDEVKELYGTWLIWIPGGAVNLYDEDTGSYVTHEYSEGADAGKVVINKDGTYSMRHDVWGKGKTVKGEWRLSSPEEINGEQVRAIILQKGIGEIDWAVAPSPNGKIRLLYAEKWDETSSLWIFDSELYK